LFIDIGANVGSYTILACAAMQARGISIEPVPSTYLSLIDNITINGLIESVKALNIGVADKESELIFTSDKNCANHVVTESEKITNVVKVKVLPLDKILYNQSPSMLKIDVEGFESSVITGGDITLKNENLHSVIMELNGSGARYGYDEAVILNTMKGYGFSTWTYDPFSRQLKSLEGKNRSSGNTLFIRNIEIVREKIEKAPEIIIRQISL
jgi:FkbM family methyltransferase